MSARVLNPLFMSELYKKSPKVRCHMPSTNQLAKVKRDLFGPVDREACKRFAENELANLQLAANERWGFDFAQCVPIPDNKKYIWERVPPTNPEMYTIIRAAHLRETSTAPNYNDLLLDERANRANMERMDLCGDEVNSSDESLCNSPTSTVPVLIVSPGKRGKQRQPKITDYLKERKRLAPTPKKLSPTTKRSRSATTTSSPLFKQRPTTSN
ncbi:cyclin-dependent kinase inhibitor 1 [Bradysia coprophila]|uniref:cyclin-dependent kinase inhibitor 1 n=1 Tax=Bradysia coprophila TaxID=38358 RepID=UPI00187DABDD|nr:cyclin-dependent kinase inhibitor 1 [Bradysia coprophila]